MLCSDCRRCAALFWCGRDIEFCDVLENAYKVSISITLNSLPFSPLRWGFFFSEDNKKPRRDAGLESEREELLFVANKFNLVIVTVLDQCKLFNHWGIPFIEASTEDIHTDTTQ